ncbi:hypothetical protein FRB96_003822 [Tulasnella sp. 330]|nr:hypothetical protein FRB96_003822 [Tulasnella sp. 330]
MCPLLAASAVPQVPSIQMETIEVHAFSTQQTLGHIIPNTDPLIGHMLFKELAWEKAADAADYVRAAPSIVADRVNGMRQHVLGVVSYRLRLSRGAEHLREGTAGGLPHSGENYIVSSWKKKKSAYHTEADVNDLTASVLTTLKSIPSKFQKSLADEIQELLDNFDGKGRLIRTNKLTSKSGHGTSRQFQSGLRKRRIVRLSTGIRDLMQSVEDTKGVSFIQRWIQDLRSSFNDWESSSPSVYPGDDDLLTS